MLLNNVLYSQFLSMCLSILRCSMTPRVIMNSIVQPPLWSQTHYVSIHSHPFIPLHTIIPTPLTQDMTIEPWSTSSLDYLLIIFGSTSDRCSCISTSSFCYCYIYVHFRFDVVKNFTSCLCYGEFLCFHKSCSEFLQLSTFKTLINFTIISLE